ncbi:hypothetical protein BOTBODRAFT_58009 [Botryobasidium botryosum FD-172 SS1]|uniref:Uncharacterized protein n=1 Tax=Botryobasidium botryosum (strain FD-172 SS1) TaxID=930990 RepID=A0A067M4I3_BOTB1|nr:hypothetical protein BOTBODRAFT_58009 [Botryobasidium botryosum FD-172 SS1]
MRASRPRPLMLPTARAVTAPTPSVAPSSRVPYLNRRPSSRRQRYPSRLPLSPVLESAEDNTFHLQQICMPIPSSVFEADDCETDSVLDQFLFRVPDASDDKKTVDGHHPRPVSQVPSPVGAVEKRECVEEEDDDDTASISSESSLSFYLTSFPLPPSTPMSPSGYPLSPITPISPPSPFPFSRRRSIPVSPPPPMISLPPIPSFPSISSVAASFVPMSAPTPNRPRVPLLQPVAPLSVTKRNNIYSHQGEVQSPSARAPTKRHALQIAPLDALTLHRALTPSRLSPTSPSSSSSSGSIPPPKFAPTTPPPPPPATGSPCSSASTLAFPSMAAPRTPSPTEWDTVVDDIYAAMTLADALEYDGPLSPDVTKYSGLFPASFLECASPPKSPESPLKSALTNVFEERVESRTAAKPLAPVRTDMERPHPYACRASAYDKPLPLPPKTKLEPEPPLTPPSSASSSGSMPSTPKSKTRTSGPGFAKHAHSASASSLASSCSSGSFYSAHSSSSPNLNLNTNVNSSSSPRGSPSPTSMRDYTRARLTSMFACPAPPVVENACGKSSPKVPKRAGIPRMLMLMGANHGNGSATSLLSS